VTQFGEKTSDYFHFRGAAAPNRGIGHKARHLLVEPVEIDGRGWNSKKAAMAATARSRLMPIRAGMPQLGRRRSILHRAEIARLPTRTDQAFTPLRIVVTTAFGTATLVILWFEQFWRYCF
jgi:hypothetical protein